LQKLLSLLVQERQANLGELINLQETGQHSMNAESVIQSKIARCHRKSNQSAQTLSAALKVVCWPC
jgi:hypothetical protein